MLIGSVLMFLSYCMAATLILLYDLSGSDDNDDSAMQQQDFSISQRVAGYFVLLAICVILASATMSAG